MTNIDQETGEVLEGEIEIPSARGLVIAQEIDVQVATARRFPRRKDKDIALKIMDRAVLSPEIAKECIYSVPRDNKSIIGPSIRFAEIVRSCYGNIRVASRFVRIDSDDKMRQAVVVEAVAMDVELNDAALTQVRRSIMTSAKDGRIPRPFSVDMIATTIQAALSIVERNAILKLVPKALWIDAQAKVLEVVRGTAETLAERRAKMLEAFKQMEVAPEELFAALGIESEAEIGLNDMPRLTGMWTALRDGEAAESVLGMAPGSRHRSQHKAVENPMSNDSRAGAEPNPVSSTKPFDVHGSATQGPNSEFDSRDGSQSSKPAPRRGRPPKSQQATAAQANPLDAEANSNSTPSDTGIEVDGEPDARDRGAEQRQEQDDAKDIPGFLDRRQQAAAPVSEYALALKFIADFKGEPGDLLNWWRKLSDARTRMSFEESGHLGKIYNGKFNELNK